MEGVHWFPLSSTPFCQLTSPPSPLFSQTWLPPPPHSPPPTSCKMLNNEQLLTDTKHNVKAASLFPIMHSACKTLPSPSIYTHHPTHPPKTPVLPALLITPYPLLLWSVHGFPRPQNDPLHANYLPPPPRGPCCVGRIAHSTRHVCCSFTLCGGVRLGCVML